MTRKALFLDRDGVVNVEKQYVHRIADFEFTEGIFDLCRAAAQHGYLLIVVTNQAGVARGYYTEDDMEQLHRWMEQEFAAREVVLSRVCYCPFHPVHGIGAYKRESAMRKPAPGMILQAQQDFALDLAASILIGDKMSDIEAGRAAGVGINILLSGEPEAHAQPPEVLHLASVRAAARWFAQRAQATSVATG